MPIVYGTKVALIDSDDFLLKCPSCETHSWANVQVICKYLHIYWIPFIPYSKEANVECKKCGLQRFGRAFDSDLISNYNEVKRKFNYPWYTYSGVGVISGFVLYIIVRSVFS